jgi:hypothetical protein
VLDGVFSVGDGPPQHAVDTPGNVAVIACGALAHELQYLRIANGWDHVQLLCLDADLHNRPRLIPGKLRQKILQAQELYSNIFVAYADCGTGGAIDAVLDEFGIERLPGAHCYSFYAGESVFQQLAEEEAGTFYLTDFLATHFQRLVVRGLKLDMYPQLFDDYFGNYRRVVYLSQRLDPVLLQAAQEAADYLKLEFQHRHSGYGDLETNLREQVIAFG